jgi:hypothetical protein
VRQRPISNFQQAVPSARLANIQKFRMKSAQLSKRETISNIECFPRVAPRPNGRLTPSGSNLLSLSAPSVARD